MRYGTVQYAQQGPVVQLTLNRPERLNAYTPEMGEDLVAAFRRSAGDDQVRAVILTGAGRVFCAGADRACFGGEPGPSGLHLGEEAFVREFAAELCALPKLVIVAFNGAAVGIGITLSLCADIRVAATGVRLKLNFAELGIVPGLGSSLLLPQLLGQGRARKLLFCDRELSAEEALEAGLVEEVCAPQELLPRAHALASQASVCPPDVVAAIKSCLNGAIHSQLDAAIAREQAAAAALRQRSARDA